MCIKKRYKTPSNSMQKLIHGISVLMECCLCGLYLDIESGFSNVICPEPIGVKFG